MKIENFSARKCEACSASDCAPVINTKEGECQTVSKLKLWFHEKVSDASKPAQREEIRTPQILKVQKVS